LQPATMRGSYLFFLYHQSLLWLFVHHYYIESGFKKVIIIAT
jgi:hypothetical protein